MPDRLPPRTRRRMAAAALFGVAVLLYAGLVAAGADLPGSGLRARLEPTSYAPCKPAARYLREPPGPAAPAQPAWRDEPSLPGRRDEPKAIVDRGRILLLSGAVPAGDGIASIRDVLSFDPTAGTYTRLPDLPQPLDHVAAGAWDGDVVVAGGYTATHATGRTWRLGSDGRWNAARPLDAARAAAGSAVLDGRLYVAGGTAVSSFDRRIFERVSDGGMRVYDFATGRWSVAPPMPTPRHHLALVAHGGKLYAIGGRRNGDFSSDAVERFDPSSGRWQRMRPMPLGVGGPAAASYDGGIVVAGGGDDAERWITAATWSYDPDRDRWTRLADLGEPRHGATLAVLGGRAYVFGGSPCPGFGLARTVESLALPRRALMGARTRTRQGARRAGSSPA